MLVLSFDAERDDDNDLIWAHIKSRCSRIFLIDADRQGETNQIRQALTDAGH